MAMESKSKQDFKFDCRNLESILREKFGDDVVVVQVLIKNLVPMGENFGSKILKLDAKIKRSEKAEIEDLHLVAKTAYEIEFECNWTELFQKEIYMYTHIIPMYNKIEREINLRKSESITYFVPKFYGYSLSSDENTNAVILLDNIQVQGYYILDKKVGLDLKHSITAIKFLAKFHALGLAAKLRYPSDFDLIKAQCNRLGFGSDGLKIAYAGIVKFFQTDPQFEAYVSRVEQIADRQKDGWCYDLVRREPWSTVVHCDFWTNNIMFHKKQSGEIDDVKFIDFQTYQYANLFVDLAYFLGTSLNEEVKLTYFGKLIDIYYEEFISLLKDMKVDLEEFRREQFDENFRQDAGKVFLHCVLALNFFSADVDKEASEEYRIELLESLIKCESFNERFLRRLTHLLQIYDERGWLH